MNEYLLFQLCVIGIGVGTLVSIGIAVAIIVREVRVEREISRQLQRDYEAGS